MPAPSQSQIAAVRRFNRFYTREVGVLRKNFLDSPWTLTEMRVLFEIAIGRQVTASEVGNVLDLDTAYLSRLLQKFERDGLVARTRSAEDARVSFLSLSAKGKKQFDAANARQIAQTTSMLGRLKPTDRTRLTSAMQMIEDLLAHGAGNADITLRDPAPGDFGWMVERHAILYHEEYGWREKFEGVCARIVADFIEHFDPKLEKCWIAEMAGQRVGYVMLVKDDPKAKKADVARIRLLLLEPQARGQGLGRRLVEECVAFSRARGYRRVTLWTHKELTAARAIYAKLGFRKTGEESHDDWGGKATSEFWDLDL
ncbi:MAG TPA: helix-turn-helix domain-containing GNAT family N-acetyltransferase [Hyphomonadaceae bacterium]|jgi:DNA-binding MarR family transcriptional regulator/N-acetylglutamate synthase-like GNAT family acetyltransferase|nr:helix-turn-helix domain-containing GNAT family N-acetyltransferase [Hyphomonadaceae bacterium]